MTSGLAHITLQLFCFLLAKPTWVTAMTLREGLLAQILRPGYRNQEGYGLALTTNLVPEHWTELLDSLIFHYPPCDMGTGMEHPELV